MVTASPNISNILDEESTGKDKTIKVMESILDPVVDKVIESSIPLSDTIINKSLDRVISFCVTKLVNADFIHLKEKYFIHILESEINSIKMHTQELENKIKDILQEKLGIKLASIHITNITDAIHLK